MKSLRDFIYEIFDESSPESLCQRLVGVRVVSVRSSPGTVTAVYFDKNYRYWDFEKNPWLLITWDNPEIAESYQTPDFLDKVILEGDE